MYSELIYTRCRQGVDILKGGRPIASDGFKVYSCSSAVTDGDIADLPLLFNMTMSKQTYNDPAFMDDAYLYAAPDKGQNIMVDFHPIPFDRSAKGDYSHRPGNFINQVFVGEFKDIYPYELFGNSETWDAQDRNEAFYYETPPQPLAERKEIAETVGSIVPDDIARFVSDGRREAVKAAVGFIIDQYSQPPENRKYLVIRDETSMYLELWIAAIESAFSPRMASGLPFATRMDKFATVNRYTVNQNGLYQTQMNLLDPKQKQRFRAMIVGVDERDKANAASVRPLPNAPYVILDGKTKKLNYDDKLSPAYYTLITSYDERHIRFCREFLQMLDVNEPTADILKLCEAYSVLDSVPHGATARDTASCLAVLEKYRMLPCAYLSKLYDAVNGALPQYLKENLLCAFTILKWLQKVAPIVGDTQATKNLDSIVSTAFSDCVYGDPLHKDTAEFWSSIRSSVFAEVAAIRLVGNETFESHRASTANYSADAWITFLQMFLPCADKAGAYTVDGLSPAILCGINACIKAKEHNKALQICEMMSSINAQVGRDLLLNLACTPGTTNSEYYMWLLLHSDADLTKSDKAAIDFAHYLQKLGPASLCDYVLGYRASLLRVPADMERYLDAVLKDPALKGCDLSKVYTSLDSKLPLNDKNSARIAARLQETRTPMMRCLNSAHICALAMLSNKKERANVVQEFRSYARQGFPSVEDEEYAEKLVNGVLTYKLSLDDIAAIVEIFASSSTYLRVLSREIIGMTTEKNCDIWNVLIDVLAANKNQDAIGIITDECMALKKADKQITQMWEMLDSPHAKNWFSWVLSEARKRRGENSQKSGLGRLFGFGGKKK